MALFSYMNIIHILTETESPFSVPTGVQFVPPLNS